jgi:hypothetical protein
MSSLSSSSGLCLWFLVLALVLVWFCSEKKTTLLIDGYSYDNYVGEVVKGSMNSK